MPRKFDDTRKKEWLELYEGGKTEKWIAHRAGCDLRTVRKAINEARLKQDVVVARREMVKEALRKHQDSLLEELDRILSSLAVPQRDFAVLSWYRGDESIFSQADDNTKQETSGAINLRLPRSEESTMRGLLKEHLKNDKLWRVLAQWEKAYAAHSTARIALQRKTVTLLEEKTGCNIVDRGDVPAPYLCSYTTGDLFFRAVLQHAFGTHKGIEFERDIAANTDSGDVRYHSSILAMVPGSEEKTKRDLLDALQELKESPEVIPVVDTYKVLEETTMKARQVVEQIKLLGLIPGQCEICHRLGI